MSNYPQTICCDMMSVHLKEETIRYFAKFREFGIPVQDGGTSKITIGFCPWCGEDLPASLRERWFETLDEMGIDYDDKVRLPEEMKTDAWWKKAGTC